MKYVKELLKEEEGSEVEEFLLDGGEGEEEELKKIGIEINS